jgi:hypothetical protein
MPGLISHEPYDDLTGAVQQVRTFLDVSLKEASNRDVVVKFERCVRGETEGGERARLSGKQAEGAARD